MFESYRNQSVNFLCNSADWFLYDATIVRLRVNDLLVAEGQYHKNCWQIFFHKSSKSWKDQLMLHVMKTFKQFTNGLRKKQKFSLLEKSIKKMVDLVCSKENANSIKWIKKKLKIGITNMLTL